MNEDSTNVPGITDTRLAEAERLYKEALDEDQRQMHANDPEEEF